jgi:hypothetical protein
VHQWFGQMQMRHANECPTGHIHRLATHPLHGPEVLFVLRSEVAGLEK